MVFSVAASLATVVLFGWALGLPAELVGEGGSGKPQKRPVTLYRLASPDYFKTMDARLLDGRFFDDQDGRDRRHVVIVNETGRRRCGPFIRGDCTAGHGGRRELAAGAPRRAARGQPLQALRTE